MILNSNGYVSNLTQWVSLLTLSPVRKMLCQITTMLPKPNSSTLASLSAFMLWRGSSMKLLTCL